MQEALHQPLRTNLPIPPSQLAIDEEQELAYFSYAVSHDLQASVRHVSSFSQLLAEEAREATPDPARINDLADTLCEVSQTLNLRLRAILAYSRINQHPLQWESLPVSELIDYVVSSYERDLQDRGITLTVEQSLAAIPGDFQLLHKLLKILFENALRFTRETPQAHIRLEVMPYGQHQVMIRCVDNGVGFEMHRQDRLFKLFSILHSRTEYAHVGIGTGLALARRIVQRLGGQISAESPEQGGAIITVCLPLSPGTPSPGYS
jgi:signal transduction histidine kinase